MTISKSVLLLLLWCWIATVSGQNKSNYLWPTNASEYMSSSFCEYRPGHYHSAIDIKTWNQDGYPCYAIADGVIDRIRVSPFGYGKVIYLKLDDGNYAIYAHLQKFNTAIDAEILQEQIRNERYTVSLNLKNRRVKKGEIIGYTGQTGIGVPHLHFEIRDNKERPVNPLHFYNNIKDSRPPVLKSILVIPLTRTSRVNHAIKEKSFSLTYVKDNNYIINEPIEVTGKIGLAIEGYDLADDVYNKFSFYQKKLSLNGHEHFNMKYDVYDFDVTRQIDIEIFYPERAKNKRIYQKLYIEPFNQLPFFNRELGDGAIETGAEDIPFRIETSDFWGNRSTVEGTLLVRNAIPAKMRLMKKMNDLAYFRLELPNHIQDLAFASASDPKLWRDIDYFEILERQFTETHQTMLVKATLNEAGDTLLKTMIQLNDDERLETFAAFENQSNSDTQLNVYNSGKYLVLDFYPLNDIAGLTLFLQNTTSGQTIQPEIIKDRWQVALDGNLFKTPGLNIKLQNEQGSIIDTALTFYPLLPGETTHFSFFGDSLRIETNPESVYDTLLFAIEDSTPEDLADSIPVFSPVYSISSAPQVFKKGITLKIKHDPVIMDPKHLGLYKLNGEERFSYVGGKLDSSNNSASARIGSFGKYFVGADTVKPAITIHSPGDGQELTKRNGIKFTAKDALSGIGSDKNIRITIDDRFVLPEWDPEKDIIIGKPHWDLEPGQHEVRIRVSDVSGNVNEQRFNVRVKGKP